MILSLLAIALVMAFFFLFGWFMRKAFAEAEKKLLEPQNAPEKHACDTCKYEICSAREEPCIDCVMGDVDRWEEA